MAVLDVLNKINPTIENFSNWEGLPMADAFDSTAQRIQQKLDQEFAEFKDVYEEMARDHQVKLKAWLGRLGELEKSQDPGWGFSPLKIECSRDYYDADGTPIYAGKFKIKPYLLLRAIEAWERGEEVTPKPFVNS